MKLSYGFLYNRDGPRGSKGQVQGRILSEDEEKKKIRLHVWVRRKKKKKKKVYRRTIGCLF